MHFNSSEEYSCGWLGTQLYRQAAPGQPQLGGSNAARAWPWQLYLQQPPGPTRPPRCPEQPRRAQAPVGLVAVRRLWNLARETHPWPVKEI